MRIGVFALFLLGLAAAADAQSRDEAREVPHPSIGLPLPNIGLPLPSMGLPLPPMGLSPQQPKPTIFDSINNQPGNQAQAPRGRDRGNRRGGGAVFLFVPAYQWPYLPGTPVPSLPSTPPADTPARGRLHIDLQSGVDPQIFIDGYFVGSMSDLDGDVDIDAGHHVLELREDGYETLHVDVDVRAGSVVTYRGTLTRIARLPVASTTDPQPPAAPSSPPSPPPPTTIYVIPGCYVGNVTPADAALPSGCDPRDAVTFPSQR